MSQIQLLVKIEMLPKNRKLKRWPMIEIVVINLTTCGQKLIKKSKFSPKIEIVVKKFWSQIEFLVKNRIFGQRSKF